MFLEIHLKPLNVIGCDALCGLGLHHHNNLMLLIKPIKISFCNVSFCH